MKALRKDLILKWKDAQSLAQATVKRGGIVVTTNGCFDLLHAGHVAYLDYARSLGDLLIVGINSDQSVKKIKGNDRPLNTENARAFVLAHLRSVDGVCVFEEETPIEWLKTIQPKIHVKGGDYEIESMPETPLLKTWGGKIVLAPFQDGFSTSSLIEKAKNKKS